ncbi:autotransporter outer membrane beta-barrel domain-containing protein [Achromobacter sp.]|uniref:autotransporter outer membrane beta-barrel domain-containing protein n=1 Tax=Achromobacter sp. TaxID=134375 RepID=UPI003C76B3AC
MKRFRLSAAAVAALSLGSTSAQAVETYEVNDSQGVPFMLVRVFGVEDGPYTDDDDDGPEKSLWNLSSSQKAGMLGGLRHWAQTINVVPGQAPAIINIGTNNDDNAYAYSPLVDGDQNLPTQVQAALQNRPPGDLTHGAHGVIVIGTLRFSNAPYIPSQLPLNVEFDLPSTVYHEVAHALGISSSTLNADTRSGRYSPYFAPNSSAWTTHLRDDYGRAAQPGQAIYCTGCENPVSDDMFDARRDQAYFSGDHVNEVLAGAMRGVPVRMLGDSGDVDDNFMSHIELKNSMMSHQNYQNYTVFMEAELAVMQDLGYKIDRRNFFGSSIYGSGLKIINDNPFFGRNAAGTAYIPNTYNTAQVGLGLHVYGSFNEVYQRADLLSAGRGGGGIRVDGEGNTVTVLPGTRVYADGPYARGVMFAYGKNHNFVQRGDVQALGEHGIAASFDFGHNAMGDDTDYRGSYIRDVQGEPDDLLDEINGPLVATVDLTGRLAGKHAAIYMSESGYVGQINVMRGASLSGDILSSYAQEDENGALRLTKLSFGTAPDANGRSTNRPDPNFAFRYDGNIVGINNLSLQMAGGVTQINGNHAVYDVNVAQGATLTGNSSYLLNPAGLFVNNGTVAPTPWGSIEVDGDYVQTPTGRLQVALDSSGEISGLAVSGNASLAGSLAIAPQRGWYATGYSVTSDEWLSADSVTGAFSSVSAVLDSPSLRATAMAQGNNTYRIAFTRDADAYARLGADGNGRSVGTALDKIAGNAGAGLQPLVAALDFSAPNGSDVQSALRQLSPSAYGAMFTGGLLRERQITDMVASAVGTDATEPAGGTAARGTWRAFAVPFGSGYRTSRSGDMAGSSGNTYGLVFGAEKVAEEERAWTVGVHAAVSGQSTRLDDQTPASGKSTAFGIGVQARYASDANAGPHAFALARIGAEDVRVNRTIDVNGYSAKPRSSWTGATATVTIGGGWRWKLGEGSSVGPVAALDYSALHRPDVSEKRSDGAGLDLDGKTFNSLRTRLGGEIRYKFPTSAGNTMTANLQSTWNHELTSGAITQTASFAGYPQASFSTRSEVVGRDSLGLQAGLSYKMGRSTTIGAAVSSNFYRGGDSDVAGTVSATWRF